MKEGVSSEGGSGKRMEKGRKIRKRKKRRNKK